MPFLTVGNNGDDLTVQIPTKRTTDWANEFLDNFVRKIVDHDHTGNGRGKPITALSIADNAITGTQILLSDGTALQWQDTTTGLPVDIIKYTEASNELEVEGLLKLNDSTIVANKTVSFPTTGSVANTGIEIADSVTIFYSATISGTNIFETGTIHVDRNNIFTHEFSASSSTSIINIFGFLNPAGPGGQPMSFHITDNITATTETIDFTYLAIRL